MLVGERLAQEEPEGIAGVVSAGDIRLVVCRRPMPHAICQVQTVTVQSPFEKLLHLLRTFNQPLQLKQFLPRQGTPASPGWRSGREPMHQCLALRHCKTSLFAN